MAVVMAVIISVLVMILCENVVIFGTRAVSAARCAFPELSDLLCHDFLLFFKYTNGMYARHMAVQSVIAGRSLGVRIDLFAFFDN